MSTYPLSKTGARQLAAAEEAIERGMSTFMEVGSALATIRDGRLYREEYGTFEDYCKGRWGFTSRRARQLIDAVEIGTSVPLSNEAQARSLAGLDPIEAREVFDEAEKRGDTTAPGLARVKAERKPATQTHRVTETTTVTFDHETGEILSPHTAEGVAPPAGQHLAVEGRGATATPSVPPSGEEDMPLATGSGAGEGVAPGQTREAPSPSSPVSSVPLDGPSLVEDFADVDGDALLLYSEDGDAIRVELPIDYAEHVCAQIHAALATWPGWKR